MPAKALGLAATVRFCGPSSPTMPAVSILLPVRDAAPYVERALASLRAQTLADLEILAIDDRSRDGSREILEHHAAADSRIRILEGQGVGLASALEEARRAARAPVVARCDADDIAHPDRLRVQFARLEAAREPLALGCRVCFFPRPRVGEGLRLYEAWLNATCTADAIDRDLFVENPIPHPTLMVAAADLERAGGWRDVPWPEDYDLVLRLRRAGCRLEKIPLVRMALREHERRLTWVDERYSQAAFVRCKASHLAEGPLAAAASFAIWGAGPTGKRLARALEAHGLKPEFFIDIDRAKVGRRRRGREVVAPEALRVRQPSLVLGVVSSRGARAIIRGRLSREFGRLEGRDFIMCA
ncbi:MAG: glycosyltransferase family 2 protein [Planctomycetota bacterium]